MIDLLQCQKPQRYIGNEWNVIKKDHKNKIKICLSYPDMYEIGMSNLGIRIIYGLLNESSDVACERVFMPGVDLINLLITNKQRLFSLETKTPLSDFGIIGFQLSQELNFINFLSILDLGGIPLRSAERKETIVIGGGINNPEPIADFVDVFLLGEFEAVAKTFIDILIKYKKKEDRLKAFAEKDGFYVPKFYSVTILGNRYCFEKTYMQAKLPIKRVYVKDLDSAYYPTKWLVPHTQIIHDRAQIEISRGCPNLCSFCQARSTYFPYRERKIERINEIIREVYKNSGYGEMTFLSLSVSDYSKIKKLIDVNFNFFKENSIGLSLPSLRIDDIFSSLYEKILSLKKIPLTVALEAVNDPLRQKLNKKIDPAKLFEVARKIRTQGIKHLKIYFMFGLPGEKKEDLIAIGRFLDALSRDSKLSLVASINPFMPKPFSVWENVLMEDESTLNNKRNTILKSTTNKRHIKISIPSIQKSILEAVISRADRNFSSVIYKVYMYIKKSNQYSECFSWEIWKDAMNQEKIDHRFYIENNLDNHPWSFIKLTKDASN